MNIILRDVTEENWYECTQLSVTDDQKANFRAPVVYWIAESKFRESYRLLAVYNHDSLIGFSVYGYDKNDSHYWICAFMIDQHHQRKGYGKAAMIKIIELLKEKYECQQIKLGHRHANKVAAMLYESLGFEEIDRTEKEVIRCLDIEVQNVKP